VARSKTVSRGDPTWSAFDLSNLSWTRPRFTRSVRL